MVKRKSEVLKTEYANAFKVHQRYNINHWWDTSYKTVKVLKNFVPRILDFKRKRTMF